MSAADTSFIQNVASTIASRELLTPGARVLVGVSGGADSMALLHVLRALGYSVEVAHLDHTTRNGVSADDAAFVREHCAELGIPVHDTRVDVPALAKGSPMSFEEAAREARYRFFIDTAREQGIETVATAHHADDQAETLLMRLLRGTSPHGLGGISPATEREGVRFVRPCIDVPRHAIMAYIYEANISFCEDASNLDPAHLRNRIRHELIPQLRTEYNPALRDALNRLAEIERAEDLYIQRHAHDFAAQCADEAGSVDRACFAKGDVALQRRAVLAWAWRSGAFPPYDRVNAAIDFILHAENGKLFDIGSGEQWEVRGDRVVTHRRESAPRDEREITLPCPGEVEAFGKRFSCRILESAPTEPLSIYCRPDRQLFDADKLGGACTLRHRRDGDRIAPLGMDGSRKLKNYFADLGVPPGDRDTEILLVGDDAVLWVVGRAVSRHAAVTPDTQRFAEVTVKP